MDIVDSQTRSRMMAGIHGKNTTPEIAIRKRLFAKGFRYRLNVANLPGKPDIVLPKYRTIILIHGCFWHYHTCSLFKMPQTRREFWEQKLSGNRVRDERNRRLLLEQGWRIVTVYECAWRFPGGDRNQEYDHIVQRIVDFVLSSRLQELVIQGHSETVDG